MRWLLLCALLLQAATCGQRGPLTLPEAVDQAHLRSNTASLP